MNFIPVLTALCLTSMVSESLAFRKFTFNPTNRIANLEVIHSVEGDITWYSDSASEVSLLVTQFNEDPDRLNETLIEYVEDVESGTATLTIRSNEGNINVADGASRWSANLLVTLGIGVLVSLFVTRNTASTICLAVIGVFIAVSTLHVSAIINMQADRTDVAILVPRGFQFASVSLTSVRGSIKVDAMLLASGTDLMCQSGESNTVCDSCCLANGVCADESCQCRPGFEGNDCGRQIGDAYTLNDDPADSVIITLNSVSGEQLKVLGHKNGDGIAETVESLILDNRERNRIVVTLNEDTSLPDRVATSTGARIDYVWSDDLSSVGVSALSQGGNQVTIDVNLTDSDEEYKRNIKLSINRKRIIEAPEIVQIPVRVDNCDNALIFGRAQFNYNNETMQWIGERRYKAFATDEDGIYHIQIGTAKEITSTEEVVENFCEQVVDALEYPCNELWDISEMQMEWICNATAKEMTVSTDLSDVVSACREGFRAVQFLCDPFSAPNAAEVICESASFAEFFHLFENYTIFLQPYAMLQDGSIIFAPGQVLNIEPGSSGELSLPTPFTIECPNNS